MRYHFCTFCRKKGITQGITENRLQRLSMPRKFKLTWQGGTGLRGGRWRKKYKGKVYYFDGGRGKSDREAYEAAVSAWEATKVELDAAAPRPHQLQYEQTIAEWEQVLAWSNRHGDQETAGIAFQKLETLRRRLAAPVLKPISHADRFFSQFDVRSIALPDDLFDKAAAELAEGSVKFNVVPPLDPESAASIADDLDGSPSRINREIWNDRLAMQQQRTALHEDSVRAHIDSFIMQKEQRADANELTVGRIYALRLHLEYFRDWLGSETAVAEIDGNVLLQFRSNLLENLKTKSWTRSTAQHYLNTIKSFVRWLWQVEAISALPRVLDGESGLLNISVHNSPVIVFTKEELKKLLESAVDRTKLYILLMLNCGMTQKDISDLKIDEIDWREGRVIRKRSKTSEHQNVPTVNYLLWTETFRLLQQERSQALGGHVLLNSNGSPLWTETMGADRKYRKTDNVKNAFDRLGKKCGIKKPLKSLKKTSATLLRGDERFQGLESLFLGHAPRSMSDKHYTQVPAKLLDQAILWLETLYEIASITVEESESATKSDNP